MFKECINDAEVQYGCFNCVNCEQILLLHEITIGIELIFTYCVLTTNFTSSSLFLLTTRHKVVHNLKFGNTKRKIENIRRAKIQEKSYLRNLQTYQFNHRLPGMRARKFLYSAQLESIYS